MNIAETIAAGEAKRAASLARQQEIMAKSVTDGATLDAAQSEEFDGLEADIEALDAHLKRLKTLEKSHVATATPAVGSSTEAGSDARGPVTTRVEVKGTNVPKGIAFTRYAMALAATSGNKGEAIELFRSRKEWSDTPEVEMLLKAAVAAGSTTDATFAGPLAPMRPVTDEFLALLRPKTIIGRIPNLREVPFNVSVPSQTGGGSYGWVGEGAAKPLTAAAFGTVTLRFAKAAGIIVLTEELVRFSSPSAEALIQAEMIAGIAAFLDTQFVDPTIAAVTNVSPASITNGTTAIVSAGVTGDNARTDIKALVASFLAANQSMDNAVFLMTETTAFALSTALNPLGQPFFPGLTAQGGTLMGIPVITSTNVGARIILVDAQGILFADEGGVNVDVSREASLQMDTAPDNPGTATTVLVSLWQRNLVGLRAERFITWNRARASSVKYVSGVAYT